MSVKSLPPINTTPSQSTTAPAATPQTSVAKPGQRSSPVPQPMSSYQTVSGSTPPPGAANPTTQAGMRPPAARFESVGRVEGLTARQVIARSAALDTCASVADLHASSTATGSPAAERLASRLEQALSLFS